MKHLMNLIYNEAWKAEWCGIDEVEERIGIAQITAVEAMQKFDPDKGRDSTFVVTAIRNKFKDHLKMKRKESEIFYKEVEGENDFAEYRQNGGVNTERAVIFQDLFNKMSDDGKKLGLIGLNTPKKVAQRGPKNQKQHLREYMKEEFGWTDYRYYQARNEIQSILE